MSRGLVPGVVLVVAAVALVACASDPASAPPPTDSPSASASTGAASPSGPTSPTPSSSPTDPYAIPDDVDETYVEQVLGELETTLAGALTAYARAESYEDPRGSEMLGAVMTPDGAQSYLGLTDLFVQQYGWEVFADPVGVPEVTVDEVAQADDECVIARVGRDAAPMYTVYERDDVPRVWLVLRALDDAQLGAEGADRHNPTPWRIQFYGTRQGEDGPPAGECP